MNDISLNETLQCVWKFDGVFILKLDVLVGKQENKKRKYTDVFNLRYTEVVYFLKS